ncbi:hypothetical protein QIS99_30570 [Streptomyces sp. B-S-A8]|uniref:Uncharacterized protein n=1 Tax=Streptomyces solicavernae TaxID=3043614 RepID=A0ABT6S3M6_9ACTN|nr:hypothetical protein [Streptomyces sp. B-S-A8]MDI3390506.1 hypothetical protein [Streptomyces sp. B-S-A8]
MTGFRADAKVLKDEGFHMFEVGQDFAKAVMELQTQLTAKEKGTTPPWGDDDMGEKFGVVYEGLRDGMFEAMGSLAERLAGMGMKFGEMGLRHEQGELAEDEYYAKLTAQHEAEGGSAARGMRSV